MQRLVKLVLVLPMLLQGCADGAAPASDSVPTSRPGPSQTVVGRIPTASQLRAALAHGSGAPSGYEVTAAEPDVFIDEARKAKDCGSRFEVLLAGPRTNLRADALFSSVAGTSSTQLSEMLVGYEDGSANRVFDEVASTFESCKSFDVASRTGGPTQSYRWMAIPAPRLGDKSFAYENGMGTFYVTYVRVGNVVCRFGAVGRIPPDLVVVAFIKGAVAKVRQIA